MDFTLKMYKKLLFALKEGGYRFVAFEDYAEADRAEKAIILRHDVDKRPGQSLKTAEIEKELGIRGSYYFRIVKASNQPEIIEKIRDLGHEIGYHYEDMTLWKGDVDKAMESFRRNLEYFRGFYPVKTICMHGSPRSSYDSRDLWKKYDYKAEGIIGEPYFDVDFDRWFYLTDTGRRWDGWKVSVRDWVEMQTKWVEEGKVYRNSSDIIIGLENMILDKKLMVTVHPQRWNNNIFKWIEEFMFQNIKNLVKRALKK